MGEADKGKPPKEAAPHETQGEATQRTAQEGAESERHDSSTGRHSRAHKTSRSSGPDDWKKLLKKPQIVAAIVTALATIGILVANSFYAIFASWQLAEIHNQSAIIETQASAAVVAANAAASAAHTAQQAMTKQQSNFATASAASEHQFSTQLQKINAGLTEQNRLASAAEGNLKTARRALVIARQGVISSERPYLWVTIKDGPGYYPDHKVGINMSITNYGKSPAVHVKWRQVLDVFTDNSIPLKERIHQAFLDVPPYEGRGGNIILPTGQPFDFLTASSGRITPSGWSYASDSDLGWVVAGFITYSDLYGNPYSLKFCYPHYRGPAQQECDRPEMR